MIEKNKIDKLQKNLHLLNYQEQLESNQSKSKEKRSKSININ